MINKSTCSSRRAATWVLFLVLCSAFCAGCRLGYRTPESAVTYGTEDRQESAYAVFENPDGTVLLVGFRYSFGAPGQSETFLLKVARTGEVLWEKPCGINRVPCGAVLAQDGSIIVGGDAAVVEDRHLYVAQIDRDGGVFWETVIEGQGHESGVAIAQSADGRIGIVGTSYAPGECADTDYESDADVYLACLDEAGEILWAESFGGGRFDRARALTATGDGGFVVAAQSNSFQTGTRLEGYVIKADGDGNFVWETILDPDDRVDERPYAVAENVDGSILVAGGASGVQPEPSLANWDHLYLAKLDTAGNILWESSIPGHRRMGRRTDVWAEAVFLPPGTNEILAVGHAGTFNEIDTIHIAKTDGNGQLLWENEVGDSRGNIWVESALLGANGGPIVSGCLSHVTYGRGRNDRDLYVVWLDANGNAL